MILKLFHKTFHQIIFLQIIKEDLLAKGHKFTTKADTEVILHGYEEYGEKILNKLRGMFSFVIYDIKTKELFGARDFFGIKPFYYFKGKNGAFVFASEIKSILEFPNMKLRAFWVILISRKNLIKKCCHYTYLFSIVL